MFVNQSKTPYDWTLACYTSATSVADAKTISSKKAVVVTVDFICYYLLFKYYKLIKNLFLERWNQSL